MKYPLKIVKTFALLIAYFIGTAWPAFSIEEHVNEGDILLYETVLEEEDPSSSFKVFNRELNRRVGTKTTVSETTEIIKNKDIGMKYGFPLSVGFSWGGDPEDFRTDTMYSYFVEKIEDVKVPAGTFKDCFKIVYATVPDVTTEWYCPGVGVIKKEYKHHGTVTNETVKLMKILKKTGKFVSPDGSKIYFTRYNTVVDGYVNSINMDGTDRRVITDGILLEVLPSGNLAVEKHKYFHVGGSYDFVWLVTPEGEEKGAITSNREEFYAWLEEDEVQRL